MEATHASRWVATAGGEWTATRGDGRVGASAVRSARVGKEIETSFGRDRARGGVARGVGTRAMMRGQRGETLKEETADGEERRARAKRGIERLTDAVMCERTRE